MQQVLDQLIDYFKQNSKGILLFSGGFDSSCLLGAAVKANADIIPYWIDNGFNRCEMNEIRQQAINLGSHRFQTVKLSPTNEVCANPANRCYHCKTQIIETLKQQGDILIDGTTSTDTGKYRPGSKALAENGVHSPLALLGITQQQTRQLAIELGADAAIAEKESCLATRFNYNHLITNERLAAIREIESLMIETSGDFNVRCRVDDNDHVRIELSSDESFNAIANPGFRQQMSDIGSRIALFTTIDLKPSRPNEYDKYLHP
jgi:uncharacterized protein